MDYRGLCIVYTGNGKGKTTAALGLALRFVGHGKRVRMIQFVKDEIRESGERVAARRLAPDMEIHALGRGFIFDGRDNRVHREAAATAWQFAGETIATGGHELVILDEISYLFSAGFLQPDEAWDTLAARPPHVTVCLTGRGMPDIFMERADLVTRMDEVRHPFQTGQTNIPCIDY